MVCVMSVSVPDNYGRWLKDHKKSPSRLLQDAIEAELYPEQDDEIAILRRNLAKAVQRLENYAQFLEKNGIKEEDYYAFLVEKSTGKQANFFRNTEGINGKSDESGNKAPQN